MLDRIFGLPVHPLVVHLTVVAVPVACVLVALCAVWSHARRRWGWATVLVSLVATGSVAVAALSGGPLARGLPPSHTIAEHAQLAKVLALLVSVMTAAAVVLVYLAWRQQDAPVAGWLPIPGRLRVLATPEPLGRVAAARWVVPVVAVISLVSAAATAVDVIAVGHLGATAAWAGH